MFVTITLADGAPACETERGILSPGSLMVVPLDMAANLIGSNPSGWVIPDLEERAAVAAELESRAGEPGTGRRRNKRNEGTS